jgi:hypothetical protein
MSDPTPRPVAERCDASVETLLLVLAGTIAMLPAQLAALPPAIREQVAMLDQVSLAEWRHDVLLLRAELLAASAATPQEILHRPE